MRVGKSFTLYGIKVDRRNPRGLAYADPGDIIDADMFPQKQRIDMFITGELVRVPFIG